MFKLDLEKAEEPEIKLSISIGSQKEQENSIKTSALLIMPKPLCRSQQTVENSSRDGNIRHHLNCLLRNLHADQEATVRERDSYVCVCVCVYIHMLLLLLLSTLLRIATCLFNL